MALSRCVFVYCEELKKGFVTRLTQDQRFEKIYEQVTELFLRQTDLEVASVELMETKPSVDWIVPPFIRVRDMHFEDAIYVQALLQPRTNEERRSDIRATAGYQLHKGGSKRKVKADETAEEAPTGSKTKTKASKKPKEGSVSAGKDAVAKTTPVATAEPVEAPAPPTEESATSEKKLEKTPKKRSSKSSKKLKVTKAEPSEKKQKLKQATLTPSQEPSQNHAAAESANKTASEKVKKTQAPAPAPAVEEPKPQEDEEKSESTTSAVSSTEEGSSSESD